MLYNPYITFSEAQRCAAVNAVESRLKERMVWKFRGMDWCPEQLSLSLSWIS